MEVFVTKSENFQNSPRGHIKKKKAFANYTSFLDNTLVGDI